MLMQEGYTKTIELKDDNPEMVNQMLRFFYDWDYDDSNDGKDAFSFNAGMYSMGDKYDAPALRDLAKFKFSSALRNFDISVTPSLLKAIRIIYRTTLPSDKKLRAMLVPVLVKYKYSFRNDEDFMALVRSDFADGDFTVDVLDAWTANGLFVPNTSPPPGCSIKHCFFCNRSRPVTE